MSGAAEQSGSRLTAPLNILPKPTPIGLRRSEAAAYVGLSPAHFDKAVAAGEMPPARDICGVKVWSIPKLSKALDPEAALPANPWL
jgi:hypothetical protein